MGSIQVLKELYDRVMAEIRPKTFPFGVKFYRSTEERPAKTLCPAHPMNVCQGTSLTRYYGRSMFFTLGDMACTIGAGAVGMMSHPEEMTSGKIAAMLHADIESAKSFTDLVPCIPFGRIRAIATAPLNALTLGPDLVVRYGNTSQVMRLIQAYLY